MIKNREFSPIHDFYPYVPYHMIDHAADFAGQTPNSETGENSGIYTQLFGKINVGSPGEGASESSNQVNQ
ncbi:MAG: hypothetical protein JSV61_09975 [Anaerolineales bacterium]|nr:MAG: hypothetical protein JSV61_09975 [Anaerolineales bacterium]